MRFNEEKLLQEFKEYIENTYKSHYSKSPEDPQTFELIARIPLRGLNFAVGNIMKYADRMGEKEGLNRKDLLKMAHFALLAMYCLDKHEKENPK